ncbi:hypothetical protein IKD57_01500 [Candidatus Saccharibacteria bacterium]|nr:hypothetical protein [Candidatus Saccharibacteria bacterium]
MFSRSTLRNEDIVFGNFRKEKKWSKKAETFKLPAEKRKNQEKAAKIALTESVVNKLLDFYKLDKSAFPSIAEAFNDAISEEIKFLYDGYGWRDIVYISTHSRLSPSLARSATELSKRIFLTSEKCSMPVSDFLLAYKGGWCTPPEVLQEWSGMDAEKQRIAYDEIVSLLTRRTLERKFRENPETARPIALAMSS